MRHISYNISLLLSVLTLLIITGCSGRPTDSRLLSLDTGLVDTAPHEALDSLAAINPASLSEADRHFYDLLTVKAKDKAYITHTSDSLILDVVKYAASHKNTGYYPEALYYAARVYSDIGDKPTAIRYYQEAIRQLPDNSKDTRLKTRILSNTARLLNRLHLHHEAAECLKATIEIERDRKDSLNLIYNLQLLGHTYMRADDFDLAKNTLLEAMDLERIYPADSGTATRSYLAHTFYQTGNKDSALMVIRGVPEIADTIDHNATLSYASKIYLENGVLDTAYIYADRLIHSANPSHKDEGYDVILDPRLRHLLPKDSIDPYFSTYGSLLNSHNDSHNSQLAIAQRALYNYEEHDKMRVKSEETTEIYRDLFLGALCLLTIGVTFHYYKKVKNQKRIIELQQTLDDLRVANLKLQTAIISSLQEKGKTPDMTGTSNEVTPKAQLNPVDLIPNVGKRKTAKLTKDSLREKIKEEYLLLAKNFEEEVTALPSIKESEAYIKLYEHLKSGKVLRHDATLWRELEDVVTTHYPNFNKNVTLLANGKLDLDAYHFLLLTKCVIRPSEMCILFSRSNGAIISRRDTLSVRLFDEKLKADIFTKAVYLL